MARNLLQFLCDLAEASEPVFRKDAVEEDNRDALELLCSLGAIEAGPRPETATCSACDADHPATLEYDPERACYVHFCPEAGYVSLKDTDLATYRFRPEWLPEWLTEALQATAPARHTPLVFGHVWHLGDALCGSTQVTVVFARRIASQANLDRLASELRTIHPAAKGLVITTSPQVPRHVQLPGGYEVVQLPVVVRENEGGLILDHQRLGSWIKGMKPTTLKGGMTRTGRPLGPFEIVAQIYKRRRARGVPVGSGRAEAAAILGEWQEHASDQGTPHISTVRRYLKKLPSGPGSR
jgi:hypothetical protein